MVGNRPLPKLANAYVMTAWLPQRSSRTHPDNWKTSRPLQTAARQRRAYVWAMHARATRGLRVGHSRATIGPRWLGHGRTTVGQRLGNAGNPQTTVGPRLCRSWATHGQRAGHFWAPWTTRGSSWGQVWAALAPALVPRLGQGCATAGGVGRGRKLPAYAGNGGGSLKRAASVA